ncbi:MAG: carboxymuconolactone decarboxylase family protein [Candidatus Gastranaerophilaceae bacterium]
MERIGLLSKEQASEKAQKALDEITQGGKAINIFKVMANSSAVLKTFSGMSSALSEKTLDAAIAERIGLWIAAVNGCEYCLAAHSYSASKTLSAEEIAASRKGKSSDKKAQAAIDFAGLVMKKSGKVSDEEFENIKKAGFSDGEILEIIAVVSLNFFTNAVNNVAHTKVDFPKPRE